MEEVAATRKAATELLRQESGPITILEESPVAESASNGGVENAIRHIRSQFRTIKAFLKSRLGGLPDLEHPVWTW